MKQNETKTCFDMLKSIGFGDLVTAFSSSRRSIGSTLVDLVRFGLEAL